MRALLRFLAVGMLGVIALRAVDLHARTTRDGYALRGLLDEWAALDNEARWLEGRVARLTRSEHLLSRARTLGVEIGSKDGEVALVPPRRTRRVDE